MRRLARWLLNALTALSLLLCLATAALWVRSYRVNDWVQWRYATHPWREWLLRTADGQVSIAHTQWADDTLVFQLGWTCFPNLLPTGDVTMPVPPGQPDRQWGGFHFQRATDVIQSWRYLGTYASVVLLAIPIAVLTAISSLLPGVRATRWIIRRRRLAARTAVGACRACGYDLTGNGSGTCPDCGTQIVQRTA